MMNRSSVISLSAFLCCVLFLVASCGEQNSNDMNRISHDGDNLDLDLHLPQALVIEGLQVYVTLNEGPRHDLTVDTDASTASGEVRNVPVGTYRLELVYYKDIGGIETVLATFGSTVTVSAGQTSQISIADGDLNRNIDDDGDGYTNLAEVRIDTDPHDKFSSPGAPPGFAVAHGSYGDNTATGYAMKSVTGEAISGSTTSTNYRITAGFTSY